MQSAFKKKKSNPERYRPLTLSKINKINKLKQNAWNKAK